MAHPAVAKRRIGKPDPVIGEIVKTFFTLKPGYDGGDNYGLN